MNQTERATIDLVINGQAAKASLKDIEKSVFSLRGEIKKMREADDPALYAAKVAEFKKLNATYKDLNGNINEVTTSWQKFKKEMGTVAVGVLGGNVLTAVFQKFIEFVPDTLKRLRDLKNELTDIEKAANMSSAEVSKLNQDFKKIDTITTRKDLRGMAVVGGQFGIKNDEMLEFVENSDKLNVALGDQFESAEEVASVSIKLRNIFQDIKTQDIGQDMLHIGNALNVLEADGAATASVMADFSSRMGGVLIPLGVTTPQIIGTSAALQELNVTAERGATATTKIFQKMLTNTAQFASVAGVSTTRFKEMIEKDVFGAFMAFVEGSKRGGQGAVAFAELLKDSELASAGASEVISKLGSNTDLVAGKIDMAGKAIGNTDSILSEFAKKNFQLAQDMKKLDEIGNSLTQSKFLESLFENGLHGLVLFLNGFKNLLGIFSNPTAVTSFIYLMGLLNISFIKATVSTIANTTAKIYNTVAYEIGFKWLQLTTLGTRAYAFSKGVLTGQITLATAAQRLWNLAIAANPIGLIITGLFALVAAIQIYSRNNAEALKLDREKVRLGKDLEKVNSSLEIIQKGINDKLDKYNSLSIIERENLLKTIKLKREEALARLQNLKARQMEIAKAAAEPSLWDKTKVAFLAGGSAANGAAMLAEKSIENFGEAYQQFAEPIKALEDNIKGFDTAFTTVSDRLNAYSNAMKIGGDTTDQLREKQSLLNIALGGAKLGSEEYKKIAAEMQKVERQLGAFTIAPKGKKEAKSQAIKDEESLNKELEAVRIKNFQDGLSARDKEVNVVMEKYNEMRKLAKNNSDKLAEIANEEGVAIHNLTIKWAEEDRKQRVEDLERKTKIYDDAQKQLYEREQRALDIKVASGEISPEGAEDQKLLNEQNYLQQQFIMRWGMGMQTADLEKQLADNFINQEKRKRDYAVNADNAVRISRQELYAAQITGLQAAGGFLSAAFKNNKGLAKAMFIAEKAAAISQVLLKGFQERAALRAATALQVAAASSTIIGLPAVPAIKIAGELQLAKSRTETFSGIAGIGATVLGEFAKGGLTGASYSNNPGGYISSPTIFNGKWIGGESGGEWAAPNWMLSNPTTANIIGAMEALRMQGPGAIAQTEKSVSSGSQQNNLSFDFVKMEGMMMNLMAVVREVDAKEVTLPLTRLEEQQAKLVNVRGL